MVFARKVLTLIPSGSKQFFESCSLAIDIHAELWRVGSDTKRYVIPRKRAQLQEKSLDHLLGSSMKTMAALGAIARSTFLLLGSIPI
jgi:hypothetical protein